MQQLSIHTNAQICNGHENIYWAGEFTYVCWFLPVDRVAERCSHLSPSTENFFSCHPMCALLALTSWRSLDLVESMIMKPNIFPLVAWTLHKFQFCYLMADVLHFSHVMLSGSMSYKYGSILSFSNCVQVRRPMTAQPTARSAHISPTQLLWLCDLWSFLIQNRNSNVHPLLIYLAATATILN